MQIKFYKYCLFLVMQLFPFVFEAVRLCLQKIERISSDLSPDFTHSIFFIIISLTLEICGRYLQRFDSISDTNIKLATQFLEILIRYAFHFHYFIYLHDEVLTQIINQSIFWPLIMHDTWFTKQLITIGLVLIFKKMMKM